jgi:uncharacterized membrane protein YkoI
MKNKDVNKAVRQAFAHAVPDVLGGVLSECCEQKGTVIVMSEKKKVYWGIKLAAVAAVLALIIGIGFGAGNYKINHTVTSTISLDVNPSIELRVNRQERVLEALALNEDAKSVLDGMDLKGSDLNVAVNAIIGAMVRNGYISEMANSILISVDSDDNADAKALQEKLTLEVSKLLDAQNFDAAVLSQTVEKESELKVKAEKYGITVGKAQLVEKITKQDLRYSFSELAGLTVHQLNLLVDQKAEQSGDLEIIGKPSEKKYIGRDAAKAAAVKHAGLAEGQVEYARVLLEFEDGAMVYEVEFCVDGWEYDYEINALDGTVLDFEKEFTGQEQLPIQPPDGDIGEQLAVDTALQHAGIPLNRVSWVNCQREEEDGVRYYEVTFRVGDWEYAYEIAAYNPMVLDWEKKQVYEITPVVPPQVDK